MSKSFKNQLLQYLYLRKKDEGEVTNTNMKFMHGMNRISIFMFLFALLVILYRFFIKK